MNGSASLRSVSRTQHGSGIPVTRSMVTSPKLAQKIPRGGATKQVTEIPVNTKAAVVSKDKAEGVTPRSGERNPLLFRKTGIPPPRGASEASERRNVTRSAFSSPQTRRKEAPRSKDTLDVNRKSLPLDVFRDLRKNGNSRDGNPRVGSNANVEPWEHSSNVKQAGEATAFPVKGRSTSRYSNENLLLRSPGRKEQKTMTQGPRASCGWGSFSDEEMGTPEDLPSKPVSPTPLCPPGGATVRMPTGTQLSRTIMATVAPFRLQINPENDVSSLEDFSDCSSDSMELCCQDLDPESQRKRTVQNVLDLRQNLEDTMSSLRGAQLSHSCLENSVCYDSDEANPLSMSSMSNRSSPLSWRYGQSSPRLQAGDAPSSAGGYHGQGAQYAAHTMPMRSPSRLTHISRLDLIEGLDPDDADLKSGYMSDSDLLGKCMQEDEDDDLTNGEELLE